MNRIPLKNDKINPNKRMKNAMNIYTVIYKERDQISGKLSEPKKVEQSFTQFKQTIQYQNSGFLVIQSMILIEDKNAHIIQPIIPQEEQNDA